jgi:hypothetical protein
MVRTLIGGLVGGLIIFILGYVFWASPLGNIAYSHATDAQAAAVQTAMAQNLTQNGTGTYMIPDPRSREGASAYTNGPIAVVNYNTGGFSPEDMSMLLPGFIVAVITGLLIAFGLAAVGGGGRSFAGVARLVVLYTLGFTVWEFLGTPIFMHYGWGFWIYSFVAESVSLIVAGLVIARWFLPHYVPAESAAPAYDSPAYDAPPAATEA